MRPRYPVTDNFIYEVIIENEEGKVHNGIAEI